MLQVLLLTARKLGINFSIWFSLFTFVREILIDIVQFWICHKFLWFLRIGRKTWNRIFRRRLQNATCKENVDKIVAVKFFLCPKWADNTRRIAFFDQVRYEIAFCPLHYSVKFGFKQAIFTFWVQSASFVIRLTPLILAKIALITIQIVAVKACKEWNFLDSDHVLEIKVYHVILGSQKDDLRRHQGVQKCLQYFDVILILYWNFLRVYLNSKQIVFNLLFFLLLTFLSLYHFWGGQGDRKTALFEF